MEQFWAYYLYMVRPGELTGHSDIHLFKHGIRPMWEVCKAFFIYQYEIVFVRNSLPVNHSSRVYLSSLLCVPSSSVHEQCHIQTFFGHTWNLLMLGAEGPKIFDVWCQWETSLCLLKRFLLLKYSYTISFISFSSYINYVWEKCWTNLFWARFFGRPSRLKTTKTRLNGALLDVPIA